MNTNTNVNKNLDMKADMKMDMDIVWTWTGHGHDQLREQENRPSYYCTLGFGPNICSSYWTIRICLISGPTKYKTIGFSEIGFITLGLSDFTSFIISW
jgi:hypothetical protein